MFRLVTISGEYGSGGADIAEIVSKELNWALLDRRLIEDISAQAGVSAEAARGCDERIDSVMHRLVRSIWHSGSDKGSAAPGEWSSFDSDRMADLTQRAIHKAADMGECVIVGRGGQCLLQSRNDAMHVFIYAPEKLKRKWVRTQHPEAHDPEAIRFQKDRERHDYIKRHFGCDWFDRHLYHMMLSSCMGAPAAAAIVIQALRSECG